MGASWVTEQLLLTYLGAIYGRQGTALITQAKNDQAVQVLKEAVRNNPNDDVAWNNLGIAYAWLGNANLAAQAFLAAIKVNPANEPAHFNLGYTYLRAGEKTKVLDQYTALTVLGSDYAGELFALLSFPKGYPVDTPYSPLQWGQTRPYKPLPAAEFPPPPEIADALRDSPDLQIPIFRSSLPRGQEPVSELGRDPGLQTPSYKSALPEDQLPGPIAPLEGKR